MSSIRQMNAMDLFNFDSCNLDPLTETYNVGFYLEYLAKWPDLCWIIESQAGNIEAYILGKVEDSPYHKPTKQPYSPNTNKNMNFLPWHAHITALTVAPDCRRQGHARKLSTLVEEEAEKQKAWFVDLFVRKDNVNAIALYKSMGYSVFRVVRGYYSDEMDAFDMRKALSRDGKRQTIRENGENYVVEPQDVWGSKTITQMMNSHVHGEATFEEVGLELGVLRQRHRFEMGIYNDDDERMAVANDAASGMAAELGLRASSEYRDSPAKDVDLSTVVPENTDHCRPPSFCAECLNDCTSEDEEPSVASDVALEMQLQALRKRERELEDQRAVGIENLAALENFFGPRPIKKGRGCKTTSASAISTKGNENTPTSVLADSKAAKATVNPATITDGIKRKPRKKIKKAKKANVVSEDGEGHSGAVADVTDNISEVERLNSKRPVLADLTINTGNNLPLLLPKRHQRPM